MLFFTNDILEVRKFCKMEHMRERYSQSSNNQLSKAQANSKS